MSQDAARLRRPQSIAITETLFFPYSDRRVDRVTEEALMTLPQSSSFQVKVAC